MWLYYLKKDYSYEAYVKLNDKDAFRADIIISRDFHNIHIEYNQSIQDLEWDVRNNKMYSEESKGIYFIIDFIFDALTDYL